MNEQQYKNFMRHIDVNPKGCWIWFGARCSQGYGAFRLGEKIMGTHVVMWEHINGVVPLDKMVCHTCDNPPCVNPSHLYLGTSKENRIDDAVRHPRKLTPEKVEEIKQLLSQGYRQKKVAAMFNVHPSLITQINTGKKWSRITT